MTFGLLSPLGLREGQWDALAGCWDSHWLHMSCILRNKGTFTPKQRSALEFHGFPSPDAFNFHYTFYHYHIPASSVCQDSRGRKERLGVCTNTSIRNIIWNNPHHKQCSVAQQPLVCHDLPPKQPSCSRHTTTPPQEAQQPRAPSSLPTLRTRSTSAVAEMINGDHIKWEQRLNTAGFWGGELESDHVKSSLLQVIL